jgi:hypothetical protein
MPEQIRWRSVSVIASETPSFAACFVGSRRLVPVSSRVEERIGIVSGRTLEQAVCLSEDSRYWLMLLSQFEVSDEQ